MPTWTETRLWKQLISSSSPERPSIEGLFQQWVPEVEKVLNAGTSPLDFTLHDAEHSFRVAEWMAKIIPEEVLPKLSAYELALLLLSAYLHDIGMTPEQARVQRHWRHLVFGPAPVEEGGLSPEEAAEFQLWLDNERDGLVPPLAQDGRPNEADLRRAAELITYYARHKHNDWSGEWIRRNATGALGSYEGWAEDLVRVCQSHHEDYADLIEEAFDPRPVGRHGEVVHFRYLACVLRVADILDMDPERTPLVLFQHRDIAPESVIYWWKDHAFKALRDGSTLVVHARPESALVEKAVRDTAESIRRELEICARLGREKPFAHSTFRASEPLPHKWSFPESLALQIRPRDDDYVYIDGAFRPNTAKLLELLSGIQLYKEPLAAVRELLQNAFDAVKEQIALERLEGDPTDEKRSDAITALQSVELRFEERDGRFWLLCIDSGAGMTRAIIEKYLLVSGSSRRHDILELERRCEAAGFKLGRTGRFGIGVLSYFMLADHVEIRTRRSTERGDAEAHGWQFQTEGVGSFGELRRDSQIKRGTTVGLRLRREVVISRDEFLSRLRKYLLDTFLRLPCTFQLIAEGDSEPRLRLVAGWQPIDVFSLVDDFISESNEHYKSRVSRQKIPKFFLDRDNLELSEWSAVAEHFRSASRWKSEVGTLPGGIGHYSLSVLFFELPGGRSRLFFDVDPKTGVAKSLPLFRAIGLTLPAKLRTSFQGMMVPCTSTDGKPLHQWVLSYFVAIDWEDPSAGQITVDRSSFALTQEASEALAWLKSRGEQYQAMVLSEAPSDYSELNSILNPFAPASSEAWWFVNHPDLNGLRWERLSLSALSGSSLNILNRAVRAERNGQVISVAQSFEVNWEVESSGLSLEWGTGRFSRAQPSQLVVVNTAPLVVIPEFVPLRGKVSEDVGFVQCEFPPAWSSVAAFESGGDRELWLWNRAHPLSRTIEAEDLDWFASYRHSGHLQISEDLLQTRGRSALYLMNILRSRGLTWQYHLAEDFRPGFWHELWNNLALKPAEIAAWIQQMDGEGYLIVLCPAGMKGIPAGDPRVPQYLPDPGGEWKLTITYKDDSASDRADQDIRRG